MRASNFILSQPWLMLPEMIQVVLDIADRVNESPELVAAKLGRPLENTRSVEMRDNVAIIPVMGPICRYATMFSEISGATSVEALAKDMRTCLENPDVHAIILDIDSPGGQAAGIGELAAQIRAGTSIKPIAAYVGNMGASAAYWIASACSSVAIAPTAILGSIGAAQAISLPRKEKDGPRQIEFVSSQSPNKRPNPETNAGKVEIQRTVDALAQVFIESVADYRGVEAKDVVAKFGGGGLFVGRSAVDCGMADKLGSLEGLIAQMSKTTGQTAPKTNHLFAGSSESIPNNLSVLHDVRTQEPHMKFNFKQLFTVWAGKGCPDTIDTSEIVAQTTDTKETNKDVAETDLTTEIINFAAATAEIERGKAALRTARVETYGMQADAFLALNSTKVTPAEKDNIRSAYVAAALVDNENPVPNFSVLAGFRSNIESRKPAVVTAELVTGDANAIKDHLDANNLKILGSAAATPDEAARQADDQMFETMMNATDEGRAALKLIGKAK